VLDASGVIRHVGNGLDPQLVATVEALTREAEARR
jgi:hypothetical protein